MVGALGEPFRQAVMQRALLEVLLLGAVCGPLGTWVLIFRQSYAAESIAHGLLPGVALAALAGAPIALGAAGGAVLAAGAIALAGREERIGADVSVAVTVTALFGAGVLLTFSGSVPTRLEALLFGDLLGIEARDLAITGLLGGAVLFVLATVHRDLVLSAFDPVAARPLGARPVRVELLLLVLVALTVVAAVQALGNLLVVALLIAPAAAARRIAGRLGTVLALSALLAAASGTGGLYASYYLDLAASASVALCALLPFAASLSLRRAAVR